MRPEDLAHGIPLTIPRARQILDTENLTPLQRRNMTRKEGEVTRRMQEFLNERIRAANDDLTERFDAIDDDRIAAVEEARKVESLVRRGRISTSDAGKRLAQVSRKVKEIRERTEQLERDQDALAALAAMTPEEYEADLLQKYPALGNRQPVLTPTEVDQP